MKKKLIILGSVAMMAVATVFALGSMESGAANSLELRNIEALSAGETSTSWGCSGPEKSCYIRCGSCGSEHGWPGAKGMVSGTHSCN